ncbi:MAG: hypothetical protein U1E87_01470 [Alphaproteobacteria bacterium]
MVQESDFSSCGSPTQTLAYDPLGRLHLSNPGSGLERRFLYDPGSGAGAGGADVVAEYDGT